MIKRRGKDVVLAYQVSFCLRSSAKGQLQQHIGQAAQQLLTHPAGKLRGGICMTAQREASRDIDKAEEGHT
jgi:hypothetical protein